MTTATLELRYAARPLRKPVAWLIPGDDPAAWLAEIAAWRVESKALRLLPLPHSPRDLAAQGVLVLDSGDALAPRSPRCIPYGQYGPQLYLPLDAQLAPQVLESELPPLLATGNHYVWHPAAGLVGYQPEDMLRLADLIALPAPSGRDWGQAQPGLRFPERIVSLTGELILSADELLEEGRDDIGSDADDIENLPPAPDEPRESLGGKLERGARQAAAHTAKFLGGLLSGGSAAGGNASARGGNAGARGSKRQSGLSKWAERQFARVTENLEQIRNKEINRLMRMLENDPDKGLRYAIPFGGDPGRGVAPPAGRLGRRNVNFSLGGLGGGGRPTDYWELDYQRRQQLTLKYRELANRELRLNRHRRAAYILAELLGDYSAAASALCEGHHWREAAVLYRERLKRPLDAAQCLEQGGLWSEAVALYGELGEYETAGDLLVRLEQHEAAAEQFEKAVEKHRVQNDFLTTARLLENKLHNPNRALEELSQGWPHSQQAGQCLRGVFSLLGRHGEHEQAARWIGGFRQQGVESAQLPLLVDILADTANNYPDRPTAKSAADCTQRLISSFLQSNPPDGISGVLLPLARLAPEDKLLGRDCSRYLEQHRKQTPLFAPSAGPQRQVKPICSVPLPSEVTWQQAQLNKDAIFAIGHREGTLVATRTHWRRRQVHNQIFWPLEPRYARTPVIFTEAANHDLVLHVPGTESLLPVRNLTPSNDFPDEVRIGGLGGIIPETLAAARQNSSTLWTAAVVGEQIVLTSISYLGGGTSSYSFPIPEECVIEEAFQDEADELPLVLAVDAKRLFVGLGQALITFVPDGEQHVQRLPEPIRSLTGPALNTRSRLVTTLHSRVSLTWHDMGEDHTEWIESGMELPVACINRGGYLIQADRQKLEVYTTNNRRVELVGKTRFLGRETAHGRPVSIFPLVRSDQFGLLREHGDIVLYEIT